VTDTTDKEDTRRITTRTRHIQTQTPHVQTEMDTTDKGEIGAMRHITDSVDDRQR